VRHVAKYRPTPPIIAAVDTEEVARRMNLVWGVRSVVVPVETDPDELFRKTGKLIVEEGLAKEGDYALIVGSLPMTNVSGRTNLVHFRKIGE
jgi:pyruvate kinase